MNGKIRTMKFAIDKIAKLNSERKSVQFAHMNGAAIPLKEIPTLDDCAVAHNFCTQVREK